MSELPNESIDTVITSPPYYGLRKYPDEANQIWGGDPECRHKWDFEEVIHDNLRFRGNNSIIRNEKNKKIHSGKKIKSGFCLRCRAWYGQLGLEPDFNLYLDHLLMIIAEIKRVLKKTGSFWLTMGDAYGGSSCGRGDYRNNNKRSVSNPMLYADKPNPQRLNRAKCLMGIPERLVIRMVDEQGWIWRNKIPWIKNNTMPSSAKDRLTNKWEPVFFFTKSNKPQYYYNVKTGLMQDKKPLGIKGKEGIDWEWRKCPDCDGVGHVIIVYKDFLRRKLDKCKKCKGSGKIKYSFWHSLDYWFDLDAIREPHKDIQDYQRHAPFNYRVREAKKGHNGIVGVKSTKEEMARYDKKGQARGPEYKGKWKDNQGYMKKLQQRVNDLRARGAPHDLALTDPRGKNPGDIFIINTQPFPEAHFATFPEKLCEKPILATCPLEICKKCGASRVRITKPTEEYAKHLGTWTPLQDKNREERIKRGFTVTSGKNKSLTASYQTIGWTDCGCNAGWRPGIVLDPFAGAGAALVVAKKMGRDYIGYEIVKHYVGMSKKRLAKTVYQMELF